MKKKIPLIVLETLEKYVHLKGGNFNTINPDPFLLKIIDTDNDSDFYFNVEECTTERISKLLIDYKPVNKHNIGNQKVWIESKSLDGYFDIWTNLLKQYETVKSFYDDPIVNAYAEEYYVEFEIIDEDCEKPLKTNQILLLDEHLENIENNIDKYITEKNKTIIQEIKDDVISLRENLTSKPKAWVVKKLSKIWGKIAKQGTSLIKEFLTEAKKQVIQKGIKFAIEQSQNLIDTINHIDSN